MGEDHNKNNNNKNNKKTTKKHIEILKKTITISHYKTILPHAGQWSIKFQLLTTTITIKL